MQGKWEDVTRGYFNREHPYALPIFDDFGLDEDGSYYYDLSPLSKSERDAREASKQRVTLEIVEDCEIMGAAKVAYHACPITSGIYASEWIAQHNEKVGFDLDKTIKTTHKLARHMGSELMGEIVSKPNVRDNLLRSAIARDHMPDHAPLAPVVREMTVKHMTQNNDYSGGQRYEDVDFMAKWYLKIDYADALVMDGPLTFSRSTDKEIMRALLVECGLHPSRPEADMDILDLNGNQIDIIDIYEKMFETVRYQVGVGMVPKEAALVVARLGDLFDHMQGKDNKISAAREAVGMSKFPDKIHPAMDKLIKVDAARFEKTRTKADAFIKNYCLAGLEREGLDDKYEQWHQEGHGRAPSSQDGMVPSLRKKLEMLEINADDVDSFFLNTMPHRDTLDGVALSQNKEALVDLVKTETIAFSMIKPTNNGHWNPKLKELRKIVETNTKLANDLDGASPTNHERLIRIASEIKDNSHKIKNEVQTMLSDNTIAGLRAESREIAKRNLALTEAVKLAPISTEAKLTVRQMYNDHDAPFDKAFESQSFDDGLFDQLHDREQAYLPPSLGSNETVFTSPNQPFLAYYCVDPKTFNAAGDSRKQQGVQGIKNAYGAAGADSDVLTQDALEACKKARAYIEKTSPGKIVYGTDNWINIYGAIARNPKAVSKTGSGAKLSSTAGMLKETKLVQRRGDAVYFLPGWEKSERLVQERVEFVKMQLGWKKRDHGTALKIYSLPADPDKTPANLEPDSLYESIVPIAKFVKEEFEAGRKVPPAITLGLIRLVETHAMIMDPKLVKRIPNPKERFEFDEIEPSLTAYMRDERKMLLGNLHSNTSDNALYPYLADRHEGLLFETEIMHRLNERALSDAALGENYKDGLQDAIGDHVAKTTKKPGEDILHVNSGLHI